MLPLLISLVAAAIEIPGFPGVKLNDNQMVFLEAKGTGTQNYICKDGKFVFDSVTAKLTEFNGNKEIGTISYLTKPDAKGGRGTWAITSGPVVGTVTAKQAWEKAGAVSTEMASGLFTVTSGTGKLGEMEYVIGLKCTGGAAPKNSCSGSKTEKVKYTCEYWFLKKKEIKNDTA